MPVEAFSRLPDVSYMKLSPDGKKVASLVRYEKGESKGVVLLMYDTTTEKSSLLLTSDNKKYTLEWLAWEGNDSLLIGTYYPTKVYGTTQVTATHLLKIDVNSKQVNSAIPPRLFRKFDRVPIVQDHVIDFLPNNHDEIIVALRGQNEVGTAVYQINHKTNKTKRLHGFKSQVLDWITDRQNNLRLAHYFKDNDIRYYHRSIGKKKWQPLFEFSTFDKSYKTPLGFGVDPNVLYYSALHDGRDAVFKMNLSNDQLKSELVYADPKFDVAGALIYSKKNQRVVGLRHSIGQGYQFWDSEYKRLQEMINKALPETKNIITGFSDDERKLVVLATSDIDAGTYYFINRNTGVALPIALRYKLLDPELMSEKKKIRYQARDGVTIHGYLTRPKHAANAPNPTIIFPHGGPISFDGKGFDYWTQFFASRGYNVLQMNFRGSYGYGFDFMASGLQDWGGKMQTDVEDGTRWLIKEGIADENRICVVGASYGGYAALMEVANNADLYQCAVSFAGVTDLPYMVRNSRKYINHKIVKEQVGSKYRELKERSPVNRANQIDVPVLLIQGTKDRVVTSVHGRRMSKRLEKAGKDVTYIELEGGNHYLSNEVHRERMFKEMDAFLTKHLGN